MGIIAFCGPSGSGKSYRKEQYLKEHSNVHTITRQSMGRIVDRAAGAYMSSADDYAAVAVATMDDTRDVVVDRFLLSRSVYWAMQFNYNRLAPEWYGYIRASLNNLRTLAITEAYNRCPTPIADDVIFLQPDIEITVILPTIYELKYRRKLSGKNYPFDARIELELYSHIALTLIERPLRGVTITLSQ